MNQFKDDSPAPSAPKSGMSPTVIVVIVLAVTFFVLAGCMVIPIALLLPAIGAARDAARMAQAQNNLKQIGFALSIYHDMHGSYPPAVVYDEEGRPMHSWRVLILPQLERADLHARYNFNEPWDGPNNSALLAEMPEVFKCIASSDLPPGETGAQLIVGEGTMFPPHGTVQERDVKDGLSNTLMLVEASKTAVKWLEPRDFDLSRLAGGETPQTEYRMLLAVTADGAAHRFSRQADPKTLHDMATIAGAEVVGFDRLIE